MILICEECGKKYQLDPARIKGTEARFACKACGHVITAVKAESIRKKISPVPAATITPATEASPSRTVSATSSETENLPPPEKPKKKKIIDDQFMRPGRFRFGLTAKLFTVMILVSLIPLVMFWGITLSQAKERIRTEAAKHSTQLFSGMVRYVDEWFGEKERIIKDLAEMDAMVSMDRSQQEPLLEAVHKIYPHLEGIFIVDADGKFFSGSTDQRLEDYSAHSFFQNMLRSQTPLWQMVKNTKTGKTALMVAVPINNSAETVGGVVHMIQIDKISKQVISSEAGNAGIAFLVKNKQAMDAYQIDIYGFKQKQLNWSPLTSAYKSGRTGLVSFQDQKGESVLGYVGQSRFGWGIAIQKDEIEVSLLIDQLMSFAYLLLVIIIVFVSIVAWFSGRALSKPIIMLTDAANRISIGALDMEIRTKRKDEIGDLSEAIARMQDSIRISIDRLRRRL
ncbi:MAG: cache domain-containing protein [Desulfobacterales bacterium]|nr:cache domain-containing protein [Desulfobacterales bacterium]